MTYQQKIIECPYLSTHGNLCSHKAMGKYCGYKQPKNCPIYLEWVELVNTTELKEKSISTPINIPKNTIQELGNDI